MEDSKSGTIEKITIDLTYPGGRKKQRVIQGDELKRLALLAFSPAAVGKYLGKLDNHDRVVRDFEEGIEGPGRGRASLVALYDDGAYSVECDDHSHNPPENM